MLTADHIIQMKEPPRDSQAAFLLSQNELLVTLGIKPSSANTGYGYIQYGIKTWKFQQPCCISGYPIQEKPDKQKANNSLNPGITRGIGYVVWRTQTILAEFQKYMPELLETITKFLFRADFKDVPVRDKIWESIHPQPSITVLWKSPKCCHDPGKRFGLERCGSWDSFLKIYSRMKMVI